MSQHSLQPVGTPEMDDAVSEDVPVAQNATAPARGTTSGRGRGRGRWARTKNPKVTKPAQQKAPSGRGRRHKVYENVKVQAAHERIQELKQVYLAVGKLVKPAVQEIADRSLNEVLEDPALYKQVPEYDATKQFLRDRHAETIQQCNDRLQHGLAMAEHVWQAQQQKVMEEYTTKVAELCEDRYGQLLRQLDILEHLYENRLPVDITEEDANCQGVFYETDGGVEVPHSGKTISQLMVKQQTLPLEAKRKADGQPEGQPAAKVPAVAKGDEAAPQLPRHPAGLLGAADAIEESGPTTPDSGSNAPTPTPTPAPEPAEEAAPERVNQRVASGAATPADGPDLPVPRGATDPDEFGVRLISRRPTRMDVPNNRIMAPNLFEWDDLDIGFRDSTNCAQKGATKQRRGKYLGRPGSNYMFIDRRAGIWDATLAAGELDDDLVKKHNLHPTLGIALPGSTNEWEPPKPTANGWKPVVFVPPSGEPIHASRTIEAARRDAETAAVERRVEVAQLLRTVCEQEGLSQEDVAPDAELAERYRTDMLVARGLDPALVAQPEPSPPPAPEPVVEDTAVFDQFADDALGAAATIEAEEEAARMAAAKRAQPSRPYDAIRDVFTDTPSARQPSPPAAQDAPPPLPPLTAADTTGLSCLADVALQPEPTMTQPAVAEPLHYEQQPPSYEHPPNGMIALGVYELPVAEYPQAAEYPQPEPAHFARQDYPSAPLEPARTNDFLRTALNPQPVSPPHHLPPQEYPGPPLAPAPGMPAQAPQATAGRTPFSNTGAAKALPALRPMRSQVNEPPAFSEPPAPHHNMVPSNSGAYFPPGANRPFHNAYSIQEQTQPMQLMMAHQSQGNPLQAPPHTGLPMGPAPLRRMSTPPPYHQPVGPPFGQAQGPAPIQFQGAPQPLAAAPASRSRPGSSSAANAAAASKYRKLEPAPTPPHRLSYSGNGQELRTVPFDYREAIKDYSAVEAPPKHGPTQIRGWTHNNIRKVTRPPTSSSSRADKAGGGGGACAGSGTAGTKKKKSGGGKRARGDDGVGAPVKKAKVAGSIFVLMPAPAPASASPLSASPLSASPLSASPLSAAPSPFVPVSPQGAIRARFRALVLYPRTSAGYRAAWRPEGGEQQQQQQNRHDQARTQVPAAPAPAPNTKARRPRARSATPAPPPGRSPYNLRSRGGAKNTDTATDKGSEGGGGFESNLTGGV
ncbi:hypothetical protein C8A01DRAFT_43644 [Parachaetomium inaequale]|uniref:Uncharacterized protein n=1 Tax=Parachaetomium inaequale TaxID=2588326 RepID=A0AAN6SV88_9PEZI|nr:hypothetical protein C8A01DRAFT_43644 [Parachaetomium inaequale]